MAKITGYLFVYGTLLNGTNTYGAYLHQHCTFISEGKFKGLLYDIGEYPGVVISGAGNQYVYGSIYLMDDAETILAFIDNYEGFGEQQEQPNLFVRVLANIETDSEPLNCWIYLYNLPVDGLPQIASGKYLG